MALDLKTRSALNRRMPATEKELDHAYELGLKEGDFPSEWRCDEECKKAYNAGREDARERRVMSSFPPA
ncbi:hypothetical protein ABMY26_06605 (plasmid) [Azospirillum sp. HJ39]|uniref:hypothetical protein n=1 Tax=Azospirillum sp. HJ39 TaxID=3159496 RepID=UPI0035562119